MFRCEEVFIIAQGSITTNPANVMVFLCSKCDDTHLQVSFLDGSGTVSISLKPEIAEQIGRQLVNPPPDNLR